MKSVLPVVMIVVAACQPGEARREAHIDASPAVDGLAYPIRQPDGSPLTATFCGSEAASRIYDNVKTCSMVACDQGDQASCEIAKQFATQHAPAGSPKKLEGMDYNEARKIVLTMGWAPLTGPCQGAVDNQTCRRFSEIGNCSGTGLGFCDMHFERSGRCLTITTAGGPPGSEIDGEPAVYGVNFSRAPCLKNYPAEPGKVTSS